MRHSQEKHCNKYLLDYSDFSHSSSREKHVLCKLMSGQSMASFSASQTDDEQTENWEKTFHAYIKLWPRFLKSLEEILCCRQEMLS